MAGVTTNKGFRYPEWTDPMSDVDYANLVNDFDIEVANQLANRRAPLRFRPFCYIYNNGAQTLASGAFTMVLNTINNDTHAMADTTNNQAKVSAAAGAGRYFAYAFTQFSPTVTGPSFELTVQKNGAYAARRKRGNTAGGISLNVPVELVLAVGDTVNVVGYVGGSGTGTFQGSPPRLFLLKMSN